MKSKKVRNIKVISQSGRNYKPTPTVILKGQWLNEMGFEIGDQIKVECENGKLVISLDRERMEMLDAEKVFMEEETKKLQARFKKEKEEIHARLRLTRSGAAFWHPFLWLSLFLNRVMESRSLRLVQIICSA